MLNLEELLNEMEFKRARLNASFRKLAFNLSTDQETYELWLEGDRVPNDAQVKLITLWVADQLELENIYDEAKGKIIKEIP